MKKITKTMTFYLITCLVALTGCATPHVMDEKSISDNDLSCSDLIEGIEEAKKFERKARDEKGFTGTNTAAVLLFPLALVATYANAQEAIDAAEERQEHLDKLYKKKGC